MADNCTIYCKTNDFEKIYSLSKENFPDADIELTSGDKPSLTIRNERGSFKVNSKVFRERADEFSRLLRSTSVFIQHDTDASTDAKTSLRSRISASQLVLGIVIEPTVDADERFNSVVFIFADALGGIIFNGTHFIDGKGEVLAEKSS